MRECWNKGLQIVKSYIVILFDHMYVCMDNGKMIGVFFPKTISQIKERFFAS